MHEVKEEESLEDMEINEEKRELEIEEEKPKIQIRLPGSNSKFQLSSSKLNTMKMKIREKLNATSCTDASLCLNIMKFKTDQNGSRTRGRKKLFDSLSMKTKKEEANETLHPITHEDMDVAKSSDKNNGERSRQPSRNGFIKVKNFRPRQVAIRFREQELKNPAAARRMWSVAIKVIEQQRRVISTLQNKNNKLSMRNKLLRAALEDLENSTNKPGNCYILLKKPGEYCIKWG